MTAAGRGRFRAGDAIILGLSSSGPAQTIAVSLASLVAACAYGGAVPILLVFVPMLGIAVAYQRLNRWNQNSGATFAWVAQVFHPLLGFVSGWMILLYYTLGTSSLTIPAGTYTLALLAPGLVDRPVAVGLAGGAWNVLVTLLALRGLKVAARFEWLIVIFQYVILLLLACVGIAALVRGTSAVHFSWSWFTLEGLGGTRGLMSGILIACFMYSGWDAAVYVNEETEDRVNAPGRAAIASVVMLALLYAFVTLGFQAVLPRAELEAHAGNALALIGERLLPGPWGTITSLVVLAGTLATLQAAVIAAARVARSMAREGVMPSILLRTAPGTGNPWAATVAMSAINLTLLAAALATDSIGVALNTVISSLGLIAVLFYGLTAAAAVWQQRARLRLGGADLLFGGVLPGLGAVFMIGVVIASIRSGAVPPAVLGYGLGSVAVGAAIALALRQSGRVRFFHSKLEQTS